MKYLKSTTQKAYTVKGYTIPKCVTPKNDYLILNDSEYSEIEKIPVIKSLIKAGGIFVSDKEPSDSIKNIENLEASNAQLIARATELEAKLKELERRREVGEIVNIAKIKEDAQAEIKAQAIQELQEKQNALEMAQKEIEELKELERRREVGEIVNIAKIKEDAQAEIKAQAIQELQEKQNALEMAQKEIEELKAQLSSKKTSKKTSAETSAEKE